MSKAESADKSREETAQALVSQCTELQTEVGLYDRVLLSGYAVRVRVLINIPLPRCRRFCVFLFLCYFGLSHSASYRVTPLT